MADIDLSFGGDFGTLFDNFKKVQGGLNEIRTTHTQVANSFKNEFKKVATEVGAVDVALEGAAQSAQQLATGVAQTTNLADVFAEQADSAERLNNALSSVDQTLVDMAQDAITEGSVFTDASDKKQVALQKEITRLKELITLSGKAANPVAVGQFTNAIKESTAKVQQLTAEIKKVPEGNSIPKAGEQVKSLQAQFRQARNEAAQLIEKFGEFSPEALEAANKAARLKEELADVNERIDALNPEKKFQAVAQAASGIAGGVTAIQGGLALIGVEGEEVQKTLLKVQAALAFSQGLNQLLGLVDAYKNIKAVIQASTLATVGNTAATTANAGAQGVATGALGAEATATTVATTATRSFTAALLANPFTAIAVALVAVTAAVISFGNAEDEAREKAKDLTKELEEQKKKLNEIAAGQFDKVIESQEFFLQSQEEVIRKTSKTSEERDKKLGELDLKRAQFTRDVLLSELRFGIQLTDQQKTQLEQSKNTIESILDKQFDERETKRREQQEKSKANLERYRNELDVMVKDLDARSRTQIINNASEQDRIEIERQTGISEVLELEKTLITKGKLINENFQLTKVQQEQINALLLGIEKKYHDESERLLREELTSRLDLITDSQAKELAAFELDFDEKAKVLRKRGLTDIEVETIRNRERQKINEKFVQTDLDNQEQFFLNQVDIQERQGQTFEEIEEQKQREILNIQLQFAKIRLQNITDDGSTEALLAKSNLEKQIKGLEQAVGELDIKTPKFSLFKLLGLTETNPGDEALFNQKLNEIAGNIVSVYQTILDQQAQFVEQRRADNDEYLSQLDANLATEEQALSNEIALAEAGFASNVDAKRKEIDAIKAEKQRALEEDKKIKEEEKKLAKEKAAIDAAIQASSLLAAGAQLFAAESPKGVVGVVIAIAAVASMIAGFLSLQAKVKAATSLEEGGNIPIGQQKKDGIVRGKRHTDGGERVGNTNIYVEDGEMVTNRISTKKYQPVLDAINRDDFSDLKFPDLRPLLEGTGVELNKEAAKNVYYNHNEYVTVEKNNYLMDNAGVEKRVDRLTEQVKDFKQQSGKTNKEYIDADGNKIIVRGNTTTIIK